MLKLKRFYNKVRLFISERNYREALQNLSIVYYSGYMDTVEYSCEWDSLMSRYSAICKKMGKKNDMLDLKFSKN